MGAEAGRHLQGRSLAAGRAARGDGEDRGDRLDERHATADPAVVDVERLDVGVAAGARRLGCEVVHEQAAAEAAEGGQDRNDPPACGTEDRARCQVHLAAGVGHGQARPDVDEQVLAPLQAVEEGDGHATRHQADEHRVEQDAAEAPEVQVAPGREQRARTPRQAQERLEMGGQPAGSRHAGQRLAARRATGYIEGPGGTRDANGGIGDGCSGEARNNQVIALLFCVPSRAGRASRRRCMGCAPRDGGMHVARSPLSSAPMKAPRHEVDPPRPTLRGAGRGMGRWPAVAVLCLVAALGCHGARSAGAPGAVTVWAAASLTDVLPQVARAWAGHGGGPVRFSFDATSRLARQIEAGAPADLFFAADEKWMAEVKSHGRIERGTDQPLLANQLVVVVPAAHGKATIHRASDLASAAVHRVAVAGEHVPAGRYADASLHALGLWDAVSRKLVRGNDVRTALAWVARGDVDAGFVYATDARVEPRVRVAFAVPGDAHPPIVYPVAVVRGARHAAAAERFLRFCRGAAARRLFAAAGFHVLAP